MNEFDSYSNNLLEQSKRFLELAKENGNEVGKIAFLNASLLISISSLEAFINSIVDEFSDSRSFSLLEKSFLTEKGLELKKGTFVISNRLKMSRLIERIEFLFQKFSKSSFDKNNSWWTDLCAGIKMRNEIVHPKKNKKLKINEIEKTLFSVIKCIDSLFKLIYKKGLPAAQMELRSKLDF